MTRAPPGPNTVKHVHPVADPRRRVVVTLHHERPLIHLPRWNGPTVNVGYPPNPDRDGSGDLEAAGPTQTHTTAPQRAGECRSFRDEARTVPRARRGAPTTDAAPGRSWRSTRGPRGAASESRRTGADPPVERQPASGPAPVDSTAFGPSTFALPSTDESISTACGTPACWWIPPQYRAGGAFPALGWLADQSAPPWSRSVAPPAGRPRKPLGPTRRCDPMRFPLAPTGHRPPVWPRSRNDRNPSRPMKPALPWCQTMALRRVVGWFGSRLRR